MSSPEQTEAPAPPSRLARVIARLRAPTASGFVRNALTLVSATVVTQALSALSAPILSRLYPPEAYGVLGLAMSVTGLLGVVSTFQYSKAIVIPAEPRDALGLTQLSALIGLGVAAVLVLPCVLLRQALAELLNSPSLAGWLPFVPLYVAIGALSGALNGWANKMERYRAMSTSRVVGVVVAMFVSLAGAYTLPGAWGLLVGYVAGQAATLAVLAKSALKEDGVAVRTFDATHLRKLASRHRRFAAYSTPTEFINVFLAQAPILLLTGFVGPAAVGLFNMTNRLLGLPNTFIAGAVSEVFQQRASSDYAERGTCRPLYLKTAKTLSLLGIVPTLVLAIGAPMLFELYLGSKWRGAGDYARILAVLNLLRLVVSPLSYVFYIAERQGEDMVAHCCMVVAIVGAMYLTHLAGGGHLAIIGAYAVVYSLVYVYYGLRGYQLAVRPSPSLS